MVQLFMTYLTFYDVAQGYTQFWSILSISAVCVLLLPIKSNNFGIVIFSDWTLNAVLSSI